MAVPARVDLLTPPTRVEVALSLAVVALGVGEVWVPFSSRQGSGSAGSATLGVLLVAVALLWARRQPLVAMSAFPLVWGSIGLLAPTYLLFYGQMVPLEIAVFMAARFGRGRTPQYAAVLAAGCLLSLDVFVPLMRAPGEVAFHWVVTTLVWSAGFGLRSLRAAGAGVHAPGDRGRGGCGPAGDAGRPRRTCPDRPRAARHRRPLRELDGGAGRCRRAGADDPDYVRTPAREHPVHRQRRTGRDAPPGLDAAPRPTTRRSLRSRGSTALPALVECSTGRGHRARA